MLKQFQSLVTGSPDAAALIDGSTGSVTTRRQLLDGAEDRAASLRQLGLSAGDLIAVQLPNSVEFVTTWLAALILRVVIIPVDRDAGATEVGAILEHFDARALVSNSITTRASKHRSVLPPQARLVKLTSGSTGRPKGIAASEANLIADFENIAASMGIRADDINLGAIPFSHSYGFSNLITPLIMQGTPIVISNDYLPQAITELVKRHRCTVVPGIPMMFDHLASTADDPGAFAGVRTFISAGAPLPAATSRRFRERFQKDIHTFYGCSESGGITYDRIGGAAERGTVGQPMTGVALDVEAGRLTVRSGSVALGYLHDASSFEAFGKGSFVTDDLVKVQVEGEVVLTGRASDQINTAGRKVNPREVEQVLLRMEGVREAKVYGEPAGARGEVVAAAVVASPEVTREEIRAFCRLHLSAHKVPRIVKLIDSIPVDERGKVRRAALVSL